MIAANEKSMRGWMFVMDGEADSRTLEANIEFKPQDIADIRTATLTHRLG